MRPNNQESPEDTLARLTAETEALRRRVAELEDRQEETLAEVVSRLWREGQAEIRRGPG